MDRENCSTDRTECNINDYLVGKNTSYIYFTLEYTK
jgi:hypothetical protein